MDATAVSRRQVFVGTGAALVTGALATVAWPAVAHADDDGDHDDERGGRVVGTWLVDSVSDFALPARQTLASFIPGGVAVAVDGSFQDPAPAGLGQWEKRNDRGFAATVLTFLYDNPATPPVNRIGMIKLVADGSVTHGSISGRYRTTVTDETGTLVFEDEGTFRGGRVQVETL